MQDKNGWYGEPIDVVRRNGNLVTIDNTRVLAAQRLRVRVRARVHEPSDPFPPERWWDDKKPPPATWGEALQARIDGQKPSFRRVYPDGSRYTGSKE